MFILYFINLYFEIFLIFKELLNQLLIFVNFKLKCSQGHKKFIYNKNLMTLSQFVCICMVNDNFVQFFFAAKDAKKTKDDDDLAELMSWAN